MNAATALAEPTAPVAEGEAAAKIEGKSPWRLGIERLRRDRAAMISLGIIGSYVFRVYQEVLQRPRYLIAEKVNLSE